MAGLFGLPPQKEVDAWLFYTLKDRPEVFSRRIKSPAVASHVPFTLAQAICALRFNIENISDNLILCLVNSAGNKPALRNDFENFPPSLLSYLRSTTALTPGSSTVPEWDVVHGLSFVQNYVRLVDNKIAVSRKSPEVDTETLYYLASKRIVSWPLAVSANSRMRGNEGKPSVPVILVFGNWEAADVELMEQHYSSTTQDRWSRLALSPEWIFHDLNSVFGKWRDVWRLAALELRDRSLGVNQEHFAGNVLQRMRRLNRAMATNIMLRESLLIQQNSMKEIVDHTSHLYLEFKSLERDDAELSFGLRCTQVDKAIHHDLLVVQGILEQLQNLMTMIISVKQISAGQSVARLGFLGFVFLPLSYVAAIFGITTWQVEPRWYPVAAIPCLFLTILAALAIPKIVSLWQKYFTKDGYAKAPEEVTTNVFIRPQDEEEAFEEVERPLHWGLPLGRSVSTSQIIPMTGPQTLVSGRVDEFEMTKEKAVSIRSGMAYHTRRGSWESGDRQRRAPWEGLDTPSLGVADGGIESQKRNNSVWGRIKRHLS